MTTNRIDQIRENYHARRALEIAICGRHSIAFMGGNTEGDRLHEVALHYGLKSYRVQYCPCGNFNSPVEPCYCEIEAVETWQATPEYVAALSADLIIQVQWYAHAADRPGEPDEAILARIADAAPEVPEVLDYTGYSLLRYFSKVYSGTGRLPKTIAVARTIARLQHASGLATVAVAEAMDYAPKGTRI